MSSSSDRTNYSSQVFDDFIHNLHDVQLTFIVVEIAIGATTVIGSMIVLALYYHTFQNSVRKKTSHKYFVALAVSDLCQGLIVAPLAIFVSFGIRTNDPFCLESMSVAVTTIFISLFLMVGMSVDRYLAITQPLKYLRVITNRVTYTVIASSWIGGIIVGVCLYYTAEISPNPERLCFVYTERTSFVFNICTVILFVIPSILLFLFIYSKLYSVILKALTPSTHSQTNALLELGRIVIHKNSHKNLQTSNGGIKIREIRSTVILFITIVIFLLSWVPGLVLLVIFRFFPGASSLSGTLAVYALAQLNSMINPFLFVRNIKNAGTILRGWFMCGSCRHGETLIRSSSSS
ncbi:adenosine receptor A3-like [Culicoides brevitarsis]|uniref:adenosine receptor A3-like n=1 Tax=Culicoides brevitarsis TaxID=469753 RepID=UPI00307B4442